MPDTLVVFEEVESIIAQGVIDSANRDIFFVYWDLLGNLITDPFKCCILFKEHLFGIVDKLFAMKRPQYCVTLAGFEPTLHPLLPELLKYLFSGNQKVRIILKTDGSKELEYFQSLFSLCPEGTLTIDLQIHPDSLITDKHISELLFLAQKHKQESHITFIYDESKPDESLRCANLLKDICVAYSCGISCTSHELDGVFENVTESLEGREAFCYQDPLYKESVPVSVTSIPFLCENFYCCLGLNALYIAPNGQFSAAKGLPLKTMGFWNVRESILAKMVEIVQCKDPFFFEGFNLVLPKFNTLEAAQKWMTKSLERFSKKERPKSLLPTREDIVRSRMFHCKEKRASYPIAADPDWVHEHFLEICDLYADLKDIQSRDVLFGVMKSLEQGDLRYLPPATPTVASPQEGEIVFVDNPALEGIVIEGSLDSMLENTREICSRICLSQEDATSCLEGCIRTVYAYKPQIHVATQNLKEILGIAQWLFQHCRNYTVTLKSEDASSVAVHAEPHEKPLCRTAPVSYPHPEISIIISVPSSNYESEAVIRCVNAIIAQERDDIEVLLITNDTYRTGDDCVATFVRTYPATVRCIRLKDVSYSELLSTGFDMALGTYCVVLEPKDTISWEFLQKGAEYIQKESPDIIAFDRVYYNGASFEHWGVVPGTYRGKDSLFAFLEDKTGEHAIEGRLIKRDFFLNLRLRFEDFGVDTSLAFGIALHLYSRKTLVVPECVCFTEKSIDEDGILYDEPLPPFAAFVAWFSNFCKDNDLESSSVYTAFEHAYYEKRESILSYFSDIADSDSVSDEVVQQLIASQSLFSSILKDYALLHCKKEGIEPKLEPEETSAYRVCVDTQEGLSPKLSVLVRGRDSDFPKTLESIVSQDMEDYECIIVDDAKDPEHLEFLQAFADFNPKIRLFAMEHESSVDICFSTALSLARGQYVIFVEEGDHCKSGYFAKAIERIEDTGADLVSFSFDLKDSLHTIRTCERSDISFEGEKCLSFLEENTDCYGIIFDRSIIRKSLNFPIASASFLSSFVRNAESIVCDATNVYERRQKDREQESAFASYAQLKSLYAAADTNADRIALLLENIAAFWLERECIPMTQEEHSALVHNTPFVRSLLRGFASLFEECDDEKCILPCVAKRKMGFFDVTQSLQPYMSLYNPICMPSSQEIAVLREKSVLLTMFLNDYATRYFGQKGDYPSLDDAILPSRKEPASYCIPARTNQPCESVLLSIIIVTRNSGDSLSSCLKSIVSEREDQIEIILVDDASDSDTSYLNALDFQKKDGRIQIYRTPWYSGTGQARNLGIAQSHGEWLLFLDPNDSLCKGFQESIAGELSKTADCIDFSWKAYSDKEQFIRDEPIQESEQKSSVFVFKDLCSTNTVCNIGLWSKVIRKSTLEKNDITFLAQRKSKSDDFLFLAQLYLSDIRLAFSNHYAVNHREGEQDQEIFFDVQSGSSVIENIVSLDRVLRSHGYQRENNDYQKILNWYADENYMHSLLYLVYMSKKVGFDFSQGYEDFLNIVSSVFLTEKNLYTFKNLLRGEIEETV